MRDVREVVSVEDRVRAVQRACYESLIEHVASEVVKAHHSHVEAAARAADERQACREGGLAQLGNVGLQTLLAED